MALSPHDLMCWWDVKHIHLLKLEYHVVLDQTVFSLPGEVALVHMLIVRHPGMFFQHFMECIFHFNNYQHHTGIQKLSCKHRFR